jgi:hypothetical protein
MKEAGFSCCPGFGESWDENEPICMDCKQLFLDEYLACQRSTLGITIWGHKVESQAGLMDKLIQEGTYRVADIEKEVTNSFGSCRKYSVREHLSHLRRNHKVNAIVDLDKLVKVIC